MNNLLSVSQVAALPDDSWVSPGLAARCAGIEVIAMKKRTGNFYKAVLTEADGSNAIAMSIFTVPKFAAGDDIQVTGKGIKKKSFNGQAQVNVSDETSIVIAPKGTPAAPVANAAHAAVAERRNVELINGQAVGAALNQAWETARHIYPGDKLLEQLTAPGFWGWLHVVASDHLRIGRMLESGNLADPVRVRQGPPSPGSQPNQGRRAATVEEELGAEEEPPF